MSAEANDPTRVGGTCPACGQAALTIEWRVELTARPIGQFSLAGQQMKFSASSIRWPHLVCTSCGVEARGTFVDE